MSVAVVVLVFLTQLTSQTQVDHQLLPEKRLELQTCPASPNATIAPPPLTAGSPPPPPLLQNAARCAHGRPGAFITVDYAQLSGVLDALKVDTTKHANKKNGKTNASTNATTDKKPAAEAAPARPPVYTLLQFVQASCPFCQQAQPTYAELAS